MSRLMQSATVVATALGAVVGLAQSSPRELPPPVEVAEAVATTAEEMRPYTDRIAGTAVTFDLVPIPGGRFRPGSPAGEPGRANDETPGGEVEIEPFWMGRVEVTWDEYNLFMLSLDSDNERETTPQDEYADAVTRPTPPYVPMDFGMGVEGYPAVGMTQLAARQYTRWLSMRTGRFYRLPTEAEWEYACRAGTVSPWSFGSDAAALADHAWFAENSDDGYAPVGTLAPNPWGLYDMHGNVAEWTLDEYAEAGYAELADDAPLRWPEKEYPRVVRGGSFRDAAEALRCGARGASRESWKRRDPQWPKSLWYHTDAPFLGFRVVRPLSVPTAEERVRYWEPQLEALRKRLDRQREGNR